MANNGNSERTPTWKWIAGISVGALGVISLFIVSLIFSDVRAQNTQIDALKKDKVEISQYRCDIERIERKLDKLIDNLIPTNKRLKSEALANEAQRDSFTASKDKKVVPK